MRRLRWWEKEMRLEHALDLLDYDRKGMLAAQI